MEESIAILLVLRDMLDFAKTAKEVKKILNAREVLVNGKVVKDKSFPIYLLDVICFPRIKKYFRLLLKGKKFTLEEINEKESNIKPYRVIGKKILKKSKMQLNLSYGRNFLITKQQAKEIKVGDCVLVDFRENRIIKHLPLKKGVKVLIVGGKHIGETGNIVDILEESDLIIIKTEKEEVKVHKDKFLILS